MSIKPIAGLVPEWFIPESEKKELTLNSTKFKLKPLNGLDMLEILSEGRIQEDGTFHPNRTGRVLLLEKGLVGWENFGDDEFDIKKANTIPAQILAEICNEIVVRSNVNEQTEKN